MKFCSVCRLCYEDSVDFCAVKDHFALTQARKGDQFQVKGYRMDSRIESGFPVETYKATHLASKKEVLIRFIGAVEDCSDLEKDLETVAKINHPNLARVFEFSEISGGDFFVVSEKPEGQNLGEFLKKISPLLERDAIQIARQIAEGLEELHSNGIVHRAVNPQNIYFKSSDNYNFEVRLLNYDFGGVIQKQVSKQANGIDARTEIFEFYSPEQFTDSKIDFRSDIYSLAVIFYKMLFGRSPYKTINPKAISEFTFKENLVEELHHDLRALLGYTLREALHQRPDLRPQTTNNLVRQLRHLELVATPAELALLDEPHLPAQKKPVETEPKQVDLKIDDFESQPKVKAAAANGNGNKPFELDLPEIAPIPEKTEQLQVADSKFEIIEYEKPEVKADETTALGLIDDYDLTEPDLYLEEIIQTEALEKVEPKNKQRALNSVRAKRLSGQNYFSSIIKNSFYVAGLIALIFFSGFVTARLFQGQSVVSSSPNSVLTESQNQDKTGQDQENLSMSDLREIGDETKIKEKTKQMQKTRPTNFARKETKPVTVSVSKVDRNTNTSKGRKSTKQSESKNRIAKNPVRKTSVKNELKNTESALKKTEKKTRPRFVPNEKIVIDPKNIPKDN